MPDERSLAEQWIEKAEALDKIQEEIDDAVKLVTHDNFVCCGMDTEKGYTLVVTVRKAPMGDEYWALNGEIMEATGFDYVEIQESPY